MIRDTFKRVDICPVNVNHRLIRFFRLFILVYFLRLMMIGANNATFLFHLPTRAAECVYLEKDNDI